MGEQRIIIEIAPDGSIKARTEGFKGDVCMDALQDLLGEKETFMSVKPSDEFYQETKVETVQTVKSERK